MNNDLLNNDYCGDVCAVKKVIHDYLFIHLSRLKDEKLRLLAMSFESDKIFERFMHYKAKLEALSIERPCPLPLSKTDVRIEFNTFIFGQTIPSNYLPSEYPNRTLDQVVVDYPERKQLLVFLLGIIEKLIVLSDFQVPDSLLKYTSGIKHLDRPDLFGPYPEAILSTSEASVFITKLYQTDTTLANSIVSILCQRINNISIRESFSSLNTDIISNCLDSLGEQLFPAIKFLTIMERVIPFDFVSDLDSVIKATHKLYRDYIFDPTLAPLAIKQSVWDLDYKYTYSYGMDVWKRLEAVKDFLSTNEYAIIEKELPPKEQFAEEIALENSEDTVEKTSNETPVLPRVQPPVIFENNLHCFSEFYELLNGTYISTSLNNFLYLFSLSNERPETIEPIIWLKPMDDLKCLLEVLYPRISKYGDFQKIFVDKKKQEFNLGSNPLQCRKRDAKKIDKTKKRAQDMKMQSFERLISNALESTR